MRKVLLIWVLAGILFCTGCVAVFEPLPVPVSVRVSYPGVYTSVVFPVIPLYPCVSTGWHHKRWHRHHRH